MSKVAVVFWSATGNTETMANCVAEGANGTIVPCSEMNAAKLAEFDAVAFGCPAMGAEQLEESEFEPMFSDLEGGCVTGWSVLRATVHRCSTVRA